MRILHVISTLDPRAGGPPRALAGLARSQREVGLQVEVMTIRSGQGGEELIEQLRGCGVEIHTVAPARTALGWHPESARLLRRLVSTADVLHIHGLWEEILHRAAREARRSAVPYLIRPCGMLDPWCLRQKALKKKIYMFLRLRRNLNAAAALHFTTDTERDLTHALRLEAPGIVEPNGVDLEEFEHLPTPGSFRKTRPDLQHRRIVLFLSRLHPKKGLDLLIPAFAATPPDAVLVLAGPVDTKYRETLERLAEEHGVANRVLFTGMLQGRDRIAALADADLFALPSYQENFGIAVVEALAAGTPVVISDQVNIHQEITQAGVGAVVPTQVEPLAGELQQWLSDPARRQEAADRARPFVWQRYDWRRIAQRWADHYQRLIEGRPSHPPADAPGRAVPS